MSIDKNEAFKHNSCKKLAQLGKVIFTLTANELDKEEENRQIQINYENSINELFEKQCKQADAIHTDLVRFRKSCIDKACTEYGNYYKQLKNEYSNLINNQTKKLQQILTELKEAKEYLKENEKTTSNLLKKVTSSSDNFFKEVKSSNDESTQKESKEATAEITKQTELLLVEFEKNIKEMKSTFSMNSKKIKKEISKLFKEAILKKKDELASLYKSVYDLKSDVNSIRKNFNGIIQAHQKQAKVWQENRNSILSAINNGNQDLKKQKDNLALQDAKNQKIRQQEINNLSINLKNSRLIQKQELEKIDQKINDKKCQIQKLMERNNSNSRSRESALSSITEGLMKDFDDEMQKRKAEFDKISAEISNIYTENEVLVQWSEKIVSKAIEKANNKLIAFQYKSEQLNKDRLEAFEKEKNEIKKQNEINNGLNQVTESSEQATKNLEQVEKDHFDQLQIELNETEEKQNKEFQEKFQKARKDIEEYRNSTKSRQEQRVEEIKISKSRREKDKQKKIDDLKVQNKKEIEKKIEEKSKEKQAKIQKLIESDKDNLAQTTQTKNFNQKKAQLESMLEFVNKQINEKKSEIEKNAVKFQNDLSAVDKSKRQLQRRIETEKRAIDDEYEMKIQVAQVNLQKAIENISKLFDADENQRGREVIEAIRKVREKKNKNSDLISRKNKSLNDLKESNKEKISELKQKLEKIQAGDREFQLKKEIEKYENETKEILKEIEVEKNNKIKVINDSITKLTSEHEKSKKKLEQQLKQKEKDFLEKIHQIEAEIKAAERFKDERISKIQADFNKKENEFAKKHAIECEKMRKRIESQKTRLNEFEQQSKSKYSQQIELWVKNTEVQQAGIWDAIKDEMKIANSKNGALDAQISDLLKKQNELEKSLIDPPQRPEEKEKIQKLNTEIQTLDEEIDAKFTELFDLLSKGPDSSLIQTSKLNKNGLLKVSKQKSLSKSPSGSSVFQALPPLEGM